MVMPLPWTHISNLFIRSNQCLDRNDFDCPWDKAVSVIEPRTAVRSLTIACSNSFGVAFPTHFDLQSSPPQFRFTCLIVAPEAWTQTLLALLAQANVPELLEMRVVANRPRTRETPPTGPQVSAVVDALASFVRNSASQLQNLTVTDVHIPTEPGALMTSSAFRRAWNILSLLEAAPSLLRLTLSERQSHLITLR